MIVVGYYPFLYAWLALRRTTLGHAVIWSGLAWTLWGLALLVGAPDRAGLDPWRYVALCFTGAAGVAVLGARRPHVTAWDFVVLGLLAVLLLPLGEYLFVGKPPTDSLRIVFLAATLAVGMVNYVPTGFFLPVVLLGGICAGECFISFNPPRFLTPRSYSLFHVGLLLLPWLALGLGRRGRADSLEINRLWRDFRDHFGLFWGQRLREQYNRGAAHAGLPGYLHWRGWQPGSQEMPISDEQLQAMASILQALCKRFGNED